MIAPKTTLILSARALVNTIKEITDGVGARKKDANVKRIGKNDAQRRGDRRDPIGEASSPKGDGRAVG